MFINLERYPRGHQFAGSLFLGGAKLSTWPWSALTESRLWCAHIKGLKWLDWTGREAMTGHHFSADDMPFEMALV